MIAVVRADCRQGISVIQALLESSEEWCVRAITAELTSAYTQVSSSQSYWNASFSMIIE
jgi:hypothetical protein